MSYPPATARPSRSYISNQNDTRPISTLSDSSFYPPEHDAGDHSLSSHAARHSSADMYASMGDDTEHLPSSPYVDRAEHDPMLSYGPLGTPSSPEMGRRGSDGYMSRGASSMNMSEIGDAESQRGIYSPGRGARTQSGLQYGYQDKDEDDELAGGGEVVGGKLKRRSGGALGGAAPISRGTSGRRAAASAGGRKGRADGGSFWTRNKRLLIIAGIIALIVIAVAVAVPIATTSKKSNKAGSANDNQSSTPTSEATATATSAKGVPTGTTGADWKTAAVGGDGSLIYVEDGSTFVYNNTFGGFWNAIPFNDSARAQADVPALNEEWDYDVNLINGVNLGGWLLLEPFISPSMFEPYNQGSTVNFTTTVVDEWTLSVALGTNLAATIENHYATFITEKDFAEIAGAGLNWVRIPLPYWAIEVYDGEPFLAHVGWTYFLKAITWARKYGLRINLDLHAVPGSQNGYNHSSKLGTINFLNGVMGIANAQRTLNYIRTLAEFISQPEYKNVVPMFSVLNEPYAATIGVDNLYHFYIQTYEMIRGGITGLGEGNGPIITFHDGFTTQAANVSSGGFNGFLGGADRIAMDSHPYLCFSIPSNDDSLGYQASKPCSYWGALFNESSAGFGLSMGGEWSLAINDCGKWINNIGNGQRYEGTYYVPGNTTAPATAGIGSCDQWNNWQAWNETTKSGFQLIANAHMDALRHWFFWTWKTGYSDDLQQIANPMWNYQLALENGFMPKNPRLSRGTCPIVVAQQGAKMATFSAPTLSAWMTGGSGAGTLLATASAQVETFGAWPPPIIGGTSATDFPTYTATGVVSTLTPEAIPTSYPSGFSSTPSVGNGWYQTTDSAAWNVPVAGCSYLNPWSGAGAAAPTEPCTGSARKIKRAPRPVALAVPTTPPRA